MKNPIYDKGLTEKEIEDYYTSIKEERDWMLQELGQQEFEHLYGTSGSNLYKAPEKARILQGGGWDYSAWSARVSFRDGNDPSNRNVNDGLRLCRTIKRRKR